MMNEFITKLLEKNAYVSDSDGYSEQLKKAKENKKCAWNFETECTGDIRAIKMMHKQIIVPVCDEHYNAHVKVMMLSEHGDDVNEILADDLNARFIKTFGTSEVNRESCMKLFAKYCPDISVLSDDELIKLLDGLV